LFIYRELDTELQRRGDYELDDLANRLDKIQALLETK
jgi:hypothetical protein